MKRSLAVILFGLLLIPSAWMAWRNREMPQFGRTHDDAIHYITAKSLAEGHGYRIQNLPGSPYETKYPPMLPWVMTLAWLKNPRFPENLQVVNAIQWAVVPVFLALAFRWFQRMGLGPAQRWAAVALLAISPYTVLFGSSIATEPLFGVFLLVALLGFDQIYSGAQHSPVWAALAGAACGAAYLTRTSGIVALVAGPLAFLLWKKRREALLFAAAMLPAVAGWMLWSKFHRTATHDVILIYNTDYLAYLALNMRLSDGSNILWKNVGHALYSLGALALPLELDSFFWQMIRTTAGVAAIAGIARKRADPRLWPFTMVAILTLTELLLWPATPNLRLMYPLTPLFAAGLIWEAEHFCRNLRRSFQRPERSQRFAAWLIGSAGATALAAAIAMPLFMDFAQLPGTVSDNERVRAENLQAYRWIESNLNPRARILSANPAMYLHTSRRTANVVCPEINWYREDAAASLAVFNGLPAYAAANGFGYVYMHVSDYGAITPDHAAEARHTMETSTMLHAIFHSGGGTLYQVSGPVRRAAR